MTGSNGFHEPLYSVELAGPAKERLRQLAVRAAEDDRIDEFFESLKIASRRLKTAPWDFGEILYRLPSLDMAFGMGIVRRLVVHFAIHQTLPHVFVRDFQTLD